MSLDPDRSIDGEVTRVESVGYLQGATGHAVFTLVFLAAGGVGYWATGWLGFPLGGIAAAFLLSANGLSIYLWDVITTYITTQDTDAGETTADSEGSGADRTLSVSLSPSTAHKSEFVASAFQVTILVVTLAVVINTYRQFGAETASLLLAGLLAVGNGGALVLEYLGVT